MGHLIGAIGDLTVDIILNGLSAIPAWGQEAEITSTVKRLGGNVGNMAVGASALGTDFHIVADIGSDENGSFVLNEVKRLGLGTDHIRVLKGEETSKTYACIRPDGERFMMTSKGTLSRIEETVLQKEIPETKVLFLGGWCLPPRVNLDKVMERMERWHNEDIVLSTDLIWSEETWRVKEILLQFLNKIDIVFLNEKELTALTGNSEREMAVKKLRSLLNLDLRKEAIAIIKMGASGAILVNGESEFFAEAFECTPVDTVGAGDLFNLGMLHARFQMRLTEQEALKFAAVFASMAISRYNSELPSQEEVLMSLSKTQKNAG